MSAALAQVELTCNLCAEVISIGAYPEENPRQVTSRALAHFQVHLDMNHGIRPAAPKEKKK